MRKFIVTHNNIMVAISDAPLAMDPQCVIEVPEEHAHRTAGELMTEFKIRNGTLVQKRARKAASELRVAFVGNWKMPCGIAHYAQALWPEVAKHVGEFKLFIEKNDHPIGSVFDFGNAMLLENQVVACWRRGESLQELLRQIRSFDPDLIWIQHEFGLWPNAGHWLSFMNQLSDRRVIVTMHSVFHHRDKTIIEAAIPEIVVHLAGARDVLKLEKKIAGKVHVVAHGCFPCQSLERLWNFYKTEHTVLQFGFGFAYKGWETSLHTVKCLKARYSDVFFTGLFSESPYNKIDHQLYYDSLMRLVSELQIEENVALIRGYQSDETLDSYLRTNHTIVFPYTSHPEHEVFGVSGAARLAMSKGLPVVTSRVNHFSDVPTAKADDPQSFADELDKLFSDAGHYKTQVMRQLDYINSNTWEQVALRYVEIFER